eukprot:COSAG01_NODE_289_length_19391_cov_119.323122_24_plen_259_part_00
MIQSGAPARCASRRHRLRGAASTEAWLRWGGGGLPGLEVTPTQSPRHLSEISSTMGKLLFALFLLPWKVAFSWTVPDVTDPRYTKHHMVAFLLSICWIGAKSIHLSAPSCPPACHPLHLAVRRVHTVTSAKLHLPSPHLTFPHLTVGWAAGVLCYYMVMWSVDVAQMLQISLSVMAFTILAVGTSVRAASRVDRTWARTFRAPPDWQHTAVGALSPPPTYHTSSLSVCLCARVCFIDARCRTQWLPSSRHARVRPTWP